MRQRTRKLIGTAALLALVIFWALFSMSFAQSGVNNLPGIWQAVVFITLGLIWILPAGLLIRWMSRPDSETM
jgi:hypothetical protein